MPFVGYAALRAPLRQRDVRESTSILGLKGDSRFHQAARASARSSIQRYSQAALDALKKRLEEDPGFNPYCA